MLQSVLEYLAFVSEALNFASPVYEFGARQADTGFDANVRSFFPDAEYVGCDKQPGPGVDRILDLHSIDLPDACAGSVLCLDTLEHVEYPRRAVDEMRRILKPHGKLVISSVMRFPIHAHPDDYWRFTPSGFRSLLQGFPTHHVGWCGQENFPTSIVGIGWNQPTSFSDAFVSGYNDWFERMQIGARVAELRFGDR